MNINAPIAKSAKLIQTKVLPNLGIYVIILVVTIVLAVSSQKYFKHLASKKATSKKILFEIFSQISYYAILFFGGVYLLAELGFNINTLLVILGSLGLALGLALQGSISNVASGILILMMGYFDIGDKVQIDGKTGNVTSFNLFSTEIKAMGVLISVPNKKITDSHFTNFNKLKTANVNFSVNISNSDKTVDIDDARHKIKAALKEKLKMIDDRNSIKVNVSDMSKQGTVLKVTYTVKSEQLAEAKKESPNIVRKVLRDNGIALSDYHYKNEGAKK